MIYKYSVYDTGVLESTLRPVRQTTQEVDDQIDTFVKELQVGIGAFGLVRKTTVNAIPAEIEISTDIPDDELTSMVAHLLSQHGLAST